MKSDQLSNVIQRSFELWDELPTEKRTALLLSGSYSVRMAKDVLYLPNERKAPGMIEVFAGTAFSILCEDLGRCLLVPKGLGAEKLGLKTKIHRDGKVVIPGIGSLFSGSTDSAVLAGCGPFVKIGETTSMEADLIEANGYVDNLLDRFGGLPTGTGRVGLAEVAT